MKDLFNEWLSEQIAIFEDWHGREATQSEIHIIAEGFNEYYADMRENYRVMAKDGQL